MNFIPARRWKRRESSRIAISRRAVLSKRRHLQFGQGSSISTVSELSFARRAFFLAPRRRSDVFFGPFFHASIFLACLCRHRRVLSSGRRFPALRLLLSGVRAFYPAPTYSRVSGDRRIPDTDDSYINQELDAPTPDARSILQHSRRISALHLFGTCRARAFH